MSSAAVSPPRYRLPFATSIPSSLSTPEAERTPRLSQLPPWKNDEELNATWSALGDKVELHAVLREGVPWETDQVGDRKFKITVFD